MTDDVRARLWATGGRWYAHILDSPAYIEVTATSRGRCIQELRKLTGDDVSLIIEVIPQIVGVAEAAEIMGWDKRRVVTYLDRDQFPEELTSLASGRIWLREDIEAFAREWEQRHPRREGVHHVRRILYLIRHGRSDFDSSEMLATARGDQWDPPLSEEGARQARLLAARLRVMELDRVAVYCSPLRRTRETVAPFADASGLSVVYDEALIEAHIGGWEGLRFEEIVAGDADLVHRIRNQQAIWNKAPGGESDRDFRTRVVTAIDAILTSSPEGDVVVVAHGGVINAYCGDVLGVPSAMFFLPENTSINSVVVDGDRRTVRFLNDIAHLTDPQLFEER